MRRWLPIAALLVSSGPALAQFVTTPNLGMQNPIPGVAPGGYGPGSYAYAIEQDLNQIDTAFGRVLDAGPLPPVPLSPDNGTPTTLYVSTTGNDANACTASGASACLTIQGAVNKLPKILRHAYNIVVGAGTFSAGAYVSGFSIDMGQYTPSASLGPYLSIHGTMATAALTGAMTGTVTSATAAGGGVLSVPPTAGVAWATATVSGAGWTTNQLAGQEFCITAGPGAGQCSVIQGNTATVATVAGGWGIATPTGASSFAIETWGTTISGTLPRPPGALSGAGTAYGNFSSIYGAAFFLASNAASGWRSGFGQGFGDSASVGSIWSNYSTTDAPIAISNFNFTGGDNSVGVGVTGTQLMAFNQNQFTSGGIGVWLTGGASGYVVANSYAGDGFGDPLVMAEGYRGQDFNVGDHGFLALIGNYGTAAASGGFNALTNSAIPTMSYQNFMSGAGTSSVETEIYFSGMTANVLSVGDWVSGCKGIDWLNGSIGGGLLIDGLACSNSSKCVGAEMGSSVTFLNNAMTGSGNTQVIQASNGSQVQLTTLPTAAGTTQLGLDGNAFSFATLAADQSIFMAPTGSRAWTGSPTVSTVFGLTLTVSDPYPFKNGGQVSGPANGSIDLQTVYDGGGAPDAGNAGWVNIHNVAGQSVTNSALDSEYIGSTGWNLNAATITYGYAAPDGTLHASAIIDNSSNIYHIAFQSQTFGAGTYTLSAYLAAGTRTTGTLLGEATTAGAYASYTLTGAGAVINTGSATGHFIGATISPVGGGWYFCTITFSGNSAPDSIGVGPGATSGGYSYVGSGQNVFAWGAMLTTGSVAYPYLQTYGTTTTAPVPDLFALSPQFGTVRASTYVAEAAGYPFCMFAAADGTCFIYNDSDLIEFGAFFVAGGGESSGTITVGGGGFGTDGVALTPNAGGTGYATYNASCTTPSCGIGLAPQNLGQVFISAGTSYCVDISAFTGDGGSNCPGISEQGPNDVLRAPDGGSVVVQDAVGPSITNVVLQSQALNTTWTTDNASVGAAVVAPDGTTTAWPITDTAANNAHAVIQTVTESVATYTMSAYFQAGTNTNAFLGGSNTALAVYSLVGIGSVSSTGGAQYLSSGITPIGGGWYFCTITFTGAASVTAYVGTGHTGATGWIYVGTGTTVNAWGIQIQTGSFATPYIQTTVTNATQPTPSWWALAAQVSSLNVEDTVNSPNFCDSTGATCWQPSVGNVMKLNGGGVNMLLTGGDYISWQNDAGFTSAGLATGEVKTLDTGQGGDGWIFGPMLTGGGGPLAGVSAMWNDSAATGTPTNVNFTLRSSNAGVILNTPTSTLNLAVGGTNVAAVTSTGEAITGTLSTTGTATFGSTTTFPASTNDRLVCTAGTAALFTGENGVVCVEQATANAQGGVQFTVQDGGPFEVVNQTLGSSTRLLECGLTAYSGCQTPSLTIGGGTATTGYCKAAQGGCSMGAGATTCTVTCFGCTNTWSCYSSPFGTAATVDAVGVSAACSSGTVTLTAKTGPTVSAETFNVHCDL